MLCKSDQGFGGNPFETLAMQADALTESELTAKREELAQLMKAEEKRLTDNGTPPVNSPLPAIYKSELLLAVYP